MWGLAWARSLAAARVRWPCRDWRLPFPQPRGQRQPAKKQSHAQIRRAARIGRSRSTTTGIWSTCSPPTSVTLKFPGTPPAAKTISLIVSREILRWWSLQAPAATSSMTPASSIINRGKRAPAGVAQPASPAESGDAGDRAACPASRPVPASHRRPDPRERNEDFGGVVFGSELPQPRRDVVAAIADGIGGAKAAASQPRRRCAASSMDFATCPRPWRYAAPPPACSTRSIAGSIRRVIATPSSPAWDAPLPRWCYAGALRIWCTSATRAPIGCAASDWHA